MHVFTDCLHHNLMNFSLLYHVIYVTLIQYDIILRLLIRTYYVLFRFIIILVRMFTSSAEIFWYLLVFPIHKLFPVICCSNEMFKRIYLLKDTLVYNRYTIVATLRESSSQLKQILHNNYEWISSESLEKNIYIYIIYIPTFSSTAMLVNCGNFCAEQTSVKGYIQSWPLNKTPRIQVPVHRSFYWKLSQYNGVVRGITHTRLM